MWRKIQALSLDHVRKQSVMQRATYHYGYLYAVDLISDNLVKVRDLTKEASIQWFDLGLELGLKERTLRIIEANHSQDVRVRFREMLSEWLKMVNPPPTWEALIAALKKDSVGLSNVAEKVEEQCSVIDCGIKSDSTNATSSATGIRMTMYA